LFSLDANAFSKYWADTSRIRNTSRSRKPADLVEDYVLEKSGRPPSKGDLLLVDTFLGRYNDMALQKPRPEVSSTLHNLKYHGIRLGTLANTSEREVSTWYRSPLSGMFDSVCFSYDIASEIPSKEAFAKILGKISSTPERSIYVGDGENGDLRVARESGFGKIILMEGFLRRHKLKSEEEISSLERAADACIQRLSELDDIIRTVSSQVN